MPAAARLLADAGRPGQLFEKSRGSGERMANQAGGVILDIQLGAQAVVETIAEFAQPLERDQGARGWPDQRYPGGESSCRITGADRRDAAARPGRVGSAAVRTP